MSIILTYACVYDSGCLKKTLLRLGSEDSTLEDVLDTLRDMLLTLHSGSDQEVQQSSSSSSSSNSSSSVDATLVEGSGDKVVVAEYKKVVTEWCAALSSIVTQLEEASE